MAPKHMEKIHEFCQRKIRETTFFQSELCCSGTEDDLSCVSNLTSPLTSALQGTRSKTNETIFQRATPDLPDDINFLSTNNKESFEKILLFFCDLKVFLIANFLNKKCPLFEEEIKVVFGVQNFLLNFSTVFV